MSLDNQELTTNPWVGREGSGLTLVPHLGRGFDRVQHHCPGRDREGFQRHRYFLECQGAFLFLSPSTPGSLNFSPELPTPCTQPFIFTQKQKQKLQYNFWESVIFTHLAEAGSLCLFLLTHTVLQSNWPTSFWPVFLCLPAICL